MGLYPENMKGCKVMVFVDGENLAIRYGDMLKEKPDLQRPTHIHYEPNVFVWSKLLKLGHRFPCEVIRRYYYTSVQGDEPNRQAVLDSLKKLGIAAPRVLH